MKFVHWGMLMLLVLVVPFLLGMFPASYLKKQHRTPAGIFICGWFVVFSSFEVVAIPFILLQRSYKILIVVYSIVILILTLLSCVGGRGLWKELRSYCSLHAIKYRFHLQQEKTVALLGWISFLVIVLAQIYMAMFYEYYDGDDAYYLPVPVLSDKFDSMYIRDPYTGYNYPLDLRHALAPTPIYIGWLSKLSGIHSTIIAHSVLSVVWLVLMYCVYSELSKHLFRKNREYRPVFLALLSIWYMFGNVSISTAETFAMTRTWQGKGLLAGVVIPCLFLCLFMFTEKEVPAGVWMLTVMVVFASLFATSVSFMLVPTVLGLAVILIGMLKSRSKRRKLCRK